MTLPDPADGDSRSMRERMLGGDLYRGADPELEAEMRQAMVLTKAFNDSDPRDPQHRRKLLEELLGSIGDEVEIRPPLHVDYGSHLHVGDRVFVNFGLTALDVAQIRIGHDVLIGPNVQLLTPTHPIDPEPRRAKWEAALPITIGDNVWIGGMAMICPGVTIGENSVIGAGAVVTRDIPANVVAVGNPARVIRSVHDA
ncbi:maltose O-acetyltransferase [Actinoplanes cyaneus]|uniref:Maltose O-acetyltransferase n=1 Tax=Actinoplanes cyaneus TaxID=52696 RepID=A0A919IKG9_9ACTN|nr:sugar O-acetyltransferase [Actinoplanes cyaneus]MCW2139991.1 maltose O-acetyltransferase [Actinoplanes cyaneus]GID67710.1 maltose O-acetyltransferase [Actinoplanes cyaneus]